ncbi:DUF6688 domain-containing protein [Alkaliphilus flagellatus]|nr:DUF6688 family protein [Alkaliphilus flagellatus]
MHIILICIFMVLPLLITVVNIIRLINAFYFKMEFSQSWIKKLKNIDIWTIVCGVIFNIILWSFLEFRDYTEPIQSGADIVDIHSPIQIAHFPTVLIFIVIGYLGYFILREKRTSLSPLMSVLNISFVLIGNLLGFLILIQLSKYLLALDNIYALFDPIIYFTLLPINFTLCSIVLIKSLKQEYIDKEFENRVYNNKILATLNRILLDSRNWTAIALLFTLPILAIIIMILILFGQQPDSIIKAFTETSDWTLSQKISPPPISVDAHYLCTVALRGHREIVKPLRYGIRGGEKIVVNRQLMIANAFEQVIEERIPRIHKYIRYMYDKYGYPLSRIITTKNRADIIYILMKPLEWLFIVFLYAIDQNPETRISSQYLPINQLDFNNKAQHSIHEG